MKKLLAIALSTILALSLVACGKSKPTNGTIAVKIGILQLLEHNALDAARQGFVQALADNGYNEGETLELDLQVAQNDQSNLLTMSQRFVNNKSDLILAIGTGAAQSVAAQTKDIPVVITAVTDPIDAGLVETLEAPGANITGTTDASPMKEQIALLLELAPQTKTIGLLYSSNEDNSVLQAKQAKEIIQKMGLSYVEQTVTSSNEVQQATQSIVSKCDAIYIPTDNTFASAMPLVGNIVKEAKTPVVCGDISMTQAGGLATLGLNYYNLGYQTGEMAVRILNGENPATMAVESLNKYDYIISADMVAALGIEVPQELQQYVK